jgi:hypothetical protein
MKLLDVKILNNDQDFSRKSKMQKSRKERTNRSNSNFKKTIYLKKINSNYKDDFRLTFIKENSDTIRFYSQSPLHRKCESVMKLLNSPKISNIPLVSYDLWSIKSKIRNRNYSRGEIKSSGRDDQFNNLFLKNKGGTILIKDEINKLLETKKDLENYFKPDGDSFEEDSLDKDLNSKNNIAKDNNLKVENKDIHIENNFIQENYKTPRNIRDNNTNQHINKNTAVLTPTRNKNTNNKVNNNINLLDQVPTKNRTNNIQKLPSKIRQIIPDDYHDAA